MTDVVYIVGPGSEHHPELRYSLRSIAANLPHDRVWIFGHKPEWVRNVEHVPTVQASRSKYVNALGNLLTALRHPDVSPTFYLFNDDFYAMRKGLRPTPKHRGTIREVIASVRSKTTRTSDYLYGNQLTDDHLRGLGIDEPLSYELHVPLPMVKADAAEILGRYDVDDHMAGVGKRSLYGNLAAIGGDKMPDPRPIRHGYWEWDWISSNDHSFRPGLKTTMFLEHTFKTPCFYEDSRTAPWTKTTMALCIDTDEHGGGRTRLFKKHDDGRLKEMVETGVWLAV